MLCDISLPVQQKSGDLSSSFSSFSLDHTVKCGTNIGSSVGLTVFERDSEKKLDVSQSFLNPNLPTPELLRLAQRSLLVCQVTSLYITLWTFWIRYNFFQENIFSFCPFLEVLWVCYLKKELFLYFKLSVPSVIGLSFWKWQSTSRIHLHTVGRQTQMNSSCNNIRQKYKHENTNTILTIRIRKKNKYIFTNVCGNLLQR